MADWYVRRGAGGDDSGQPDWANAAQDMEAVDAGPAAGDTVYVAGSHSEQDNASKSINFASGTDDAPIKIICADEASGEPPTTYETMDDGGGVIETTGAGDDILLSGFATWYGAKFDCGDKFTFSGTAKQRFSECIFICVDTFSMANDEASYQFIDCTFTLGATQGVFAVGSDCSCLIRGGIFTTARSTGIFTLGQSATLIVEDCDLSTEETLVSSLIGRSQATFRRCKLNAGTLAAPSSDTFDHPDTWILIESSNAEGNNIVPVLGMQYFEGFWGKVEIETTEYRTGGASDGETPYSWKMTDNANTVPRHSPLRSPPIVAWKDAGSETLTVYVAHDAVGGGAAGDLLDTECWLEISSPDETANPNTTSLGKYQDTQPATVLAAASDLTNEGADNWQAAPTTYQQITATIAPAEAGPITVRVCMALVSSPDVVFVDPKLYIA